MILVTGANGQVGQELQALAANYPQFKFYFADRNVLDIGDAAAVNAFFDKNAVAYCINCAAYTAVDRAEEETAMAEKINTEAVANLAKACALHQARLIHFSTDYVYHGASNVPYKETDEVSPKSVYAVTKRAGEVAALAHCAESVVIRTSWVYSTYGNNFVKTMLRLGAKLDSLRVVFDQIGAPTYAHDLAKASLDIVQFLETETSATPTVYGIFNYCNEGVTSWFDFAKAIFEIENIDINLRPIESKDYPTPAARPHFSVMNLQKIRETFGLEIPYWGESLRACLEKLSK